MRGRAACCRHASKRAAVRRRKVPMVNEPGCVAWPVRSRSVNNAEEYFSNGRKDSDSFRVPIMRGNGSH